jgi:xylulokinase
MAFYLGLDLSTQSLTAVIIEVDPPSIAAARRREIVLEEAINFERDLPRHGTRSGVLPSEEATVAHSSPRLWAEALELMLLRLKDRGAPLGAIRAVAGSGQQHGSVYLDAGAEAALAGLDPARPLLEQIEGSFSRATAPIWMDSSTAEECAEITDSLGGPQRVAELTGSRAYERFAGPQVRKFYKQEPEAYASTATVHLVSSYMASLLAGRSAPIDPGDGAGMNLMDIRKRAWSTVALAATAPGLKGKLPPIADSWTVVGPLSPYYARRFGFSPSARSIVWSGDNPCSLIGVGLVEAGRIAISLGTSDTLFGFLPELRIDPAGDGHVFGAPTGHFMSLICFKNGSLAREKVRERLRLDWGGFNEALAAAPPGNRGRVLVPWFDPEITPTVLEPGARFYGLDWSAGPALARAVVEGQCASMALHSRWMGVAARSIYATGGASRNRAILGVLADVFGADVFPFKARNSAALGAALRAWHADRVAEGESPRWPEIVAGFTEPERAGVLRPDPERHRLYQRFVAVYGACEDHALGRGPDPAPLQAGW